MKAKQGGYKLKAALLLLLNLIGIVGFALKPIPEKPNPPRLVNDYAGVLSAQERELLESKLVAYNDSTSTQIAIVIETTLDDRELFEYCQELFEAWGIGSKNDNGILLYVSIEQRKVRIHTGYGMECFITDAISRRIIETNIRPNFGKQQYYQGLNEATDAIILASVGEYLGSKPELKKKDFIVPVGIVVFVVVLMIYFGWRQEKAIRKVMREQGVSYQEARKLLGLDRGPRGGGGWGDFRTGGGSFGGWGSGGGGGFGGFGGGHSGGGGASGGW